MPSKNSFIAAVQKRTGLVNAQYAAALAKLVLQAVLDEANTGTLVLRGIGTFKPVERKARTARNPRTGAVVAVPPRRVIVFKQANKPAR